MSDAARRLLLAAGALLLGMGTATAPASAQVTGRDTTVVRVPARGDTLARDTTAGRDTSEAPNRVMAPLARPPEPASLAVGGDFAWDRDALFSTGAVTLSDLLERLPGVTAYRTGWLVTPEHATYGGAFGRIRVFYDGVEIDPLHPRTGGLLDLSRIELWTLEDVRVERAAGELRVHVRSWRVQNTTPYTRTDVSTGEYDTNLFRGFFGKRFGRGEVLQTGFQQYATRAPQLGGDGDQLALFARLGWAAGPWSVDGLLQRSGRLQNLLTRRFERTDLPQLDATTQLAYLRAGYRDPSEPGVWGQVVVSAQSFREETPWRAELGAEIPADSADTTRSRAQYVAMAGWNVGALSLTGIARLRAYEGERLFSPAARATMRRGWLEAQLYGERSAEDSTTRLDAELRLTPLPKLAASVAASRLVADDETGRGAVTAGRAELGARLGRTWLVGGVTTRHGDATRAPVIYDPTFQSVELGTTTGIYGGIRGPVWKDVSAEVMAVQWSEGDAGLIYRPEQQLRAQLTLDTRWLSRFPTGEFGFKLSGTVEYRAGTLFPVSTDEGALATISSTVVNGQIEIRIQDAIAFLQARNALATQYELVPGYLMPRNLLIYGVRWQFWN